MKAKYTLTIEGDVALVEGDYKQVGSVTVTEEMLLPEEKPDIRTSTFSTVGQAFDFASYRCASMANQSAVLSEIHQVANEVQN